MVKRYFIAILMFLLTFAVHAQEFADKSFYLLDSLVLDDLTSSDRTLIDSTLKLYHQASHDTTKLNYLGHIVDESWDEAVWPKYNQVMYKKVQEILSAGPPPTLEKKYLWSLAETLNNIGYIYDDQGDIPKALEHYHKSLKIREEIGDKNGIAMSLNNIGIIYDDQGDIPKALECYHKSLKILEELGDKNGIATSLNNIGGIYMSQGDIHKALEFLHKSLKIEEELGNKSGIATSLNNIGMIYDDQGDIPKALECYHKSLKILEEIGDKNGIASSLNNIGGIYSNQGDIPKALEFFHKSLKIREEIGNKLGMAYSLNNIGMIELERESFASALNYGMRGLQIAREIGSPRLISLNSGLLSKVAKKQWNYQEALEMYELHIQMRDSIKNEETQKASIRQQTKYEFEKAQLVNEQEEKEVARLVAEKTARRDNLQYSVMLICLLVIGGLVAMLGRLSLPERVAEGLIFFAFLLFFEFLLVLADPYIEGWSGGAPGIKLLFNAAIAALIFPAHAFFESKLKKRLVKSRDEIHENL